MAGDRKPPVESRGASAPVERGTAAVDSFLAEARRLAAQPKRGRLVFALDATMSRQPTWDMACSLQAEMFSEAAAIGGLSVQLVYFRGFDECRASRFVDDPRALTGLMTQIDCRGGHTQIAKVLRHVRGEARAETLRAFVYVGDAMEESLDELAGLAGELGLLSVKGFVFQEGADRAAEQAFRSIARLTGGAYASFAPGAASTLRGLLRAAASYAAGGRAALEKLTAAGAAPRGLLTQLR